MIGSDSMLAWESSPIGEPNTSDRSSDSTINSKARTPETPPDHIHINGASSINNPNPPPAALGQPWDTFPVSNAHNYTQSRLNQDQDQALAYVISQLAASSLGNDAVPSRQSSYCAEPSSRVQTLDHNNSNNSNNNYILDSTPLNTEDESRITTMPRSRPQPQPPRAIPSDPWGNILQQRNITTLQNSFWSGFQQNDSSSSTPSAAILTPNNVAVAPATLSTYTSRFQPPVPTTNSTTTHNNNWTPYSHRRRSEEVTPFVPQASINGRNNFAPEVRRHSDLTTSTRLNNQPLNHVHSLSIQANTTIGGSDLVTGPFLPVTGYTTNITQPIGPQSVFPSGFLPMQAVANPQGRLQSLQQQPMLETSIPTSNNIDLAISQRFSSRYHGMHTDNNASAEHIADEENCALWLTNLPPNVSTRELLAEIRNIGRIWCTYINEPDHISHQTAAAKVVFYTADAAKRLLSQSWTQGLIVRGYRVKVAHNRIKYGPRPADGKMTTRVLIITGNSKFVNSTSLSQYFDHRFVYQVDEAVELITAGNRTVVEFKFGSYRCQAQMGKMSLEMDKPEGFEKVEFGEDPCETGNSLRSYGIAAERIQGIGLSNYTQ